MAYHYDLERLGYSKNDILLMIHADDAGLSCSENAATIEALKKGTVTSFSIMVPCPWFGDIANFAKQHPQYDCGIHLTLTCEWKHYKFGPVLPYSEVPSLVDERGFFHTKREQVKKLAKPQEVKKELKAQIDRALNAGIKPTHLDSHMYTLGLTKELLDVYRELGKEYKLPIFLSDELLEGVGNLGSLQESDSIVHKVHIGNFKAMQSTGLGELYTQMLNNLTAGLNVILIHPAFDNMEMKQVCVDHPNFGSEWRQMDFDFFTDPNTAALLEERNIKPITWRELQRTIH
ncbi:polysaccharide deacetylase family protein [Arenibacter sp. BSSL-BM3]|uniref:Polysaccharide deacetylase family protein n=1 Tax=Arenibacter arenosicollis TaxID=2762274 RepID=A0ABR7QM13_9FLAO|nr:polysaccharide deacetylase family protein [Arenibacter arenosicollis]MBC8768231.1 polysaccharide deacetylase family protein [Arenibacter arenosicollis]